MPASHKKSMEIIPIIIRLASPDPPKSNLQDTVTGGITHSSQVEAPQGLGESASDAVRVTPGYNGRVIIACKSLDRSPRW